MTRKISQGYSVNEQEKSVRVWDKGLYRGMLWYLMDNYDDVYGAGGGMIMCFYKDEKGYVDINIRTRLLHANNMGMFNEVLKLINLISKEDVKRKKSIDKKIIFEI